jgi:hypothetical protein
MEPGGEDDARANGACRVILASKIEEMIKALPTPPPST